MELGASTGRLATTIDRGLGVAEKVLELVIEEKRIDRLALEKGNTAMLNKYLDMMIRREEHRLTLMDRWEKNIAEPFDEFVERMREDLGDDLADRMRAFFSGETEPEPAG